ncbi:MAG: HNH endonuclease [bacterium]
MWFVEPRSRNVFFEQILSKPYGQEFLDLFEREIEPYVVELTNTCVIYVANKQSAESFQIRTFLGGNILFSIDLNKIKYPRFVLYTVNSGWKRYSFSKFMNSNWKRTLKEAYEYLISNGIQDSTEVIESVLKKVNKGLTRDEIIYYVKSKHLIHNSLYEDLKQKIIKQANKNNKFILKSNRKIYLREWQYTKFDEEDEVSNYKDIDSSYPWEGEATPQPKPKKEVKKKYVYRTNPELKKRAFINDNYECQFDQEHKWFVSSVTGKNYVEGHHLIPMGFQDYFDVSLDVLGNIITLCPLCHKRIHHSLNIIEIVKRLYQIKKKNLEGYGLFISEKELIDLYN